MITESKVIANGVYVDAGIIVMVDADHFKGNKTKAKSFLYYKKTFAPGRYKVKWEIHKTWNGDISGEGEIVLTSGHLVVTDPCYHVDSEKWHDWLNKNDGEVSDGVYIDSMGGDGLYRVYVTLTPIEVKAKSTKPKSIKQGTKSTTMKRITNLQAYILIKNTKGKIFSVYFKKTDGTIRHMVCRLGVKKYVTGKGMSWNPELRSKLSVFDTQKNEYRMINLDSIMGLTIAGQEYLVGSTLLTDYLDAKAKQEHKKSPSNSPAKWTGADVIAKATEIARLLNKVKAPKA